MDIADYKKYALPKIEAGKMVKVLRQAIKSVKNSEQDQYEKQKDIYKPIVEKLEEEAKDISDLRKALAPTEEEQKALQAALPAPPQQAALPAPPDIPAITITPPPPDIPAITITPPEPLQDPLVVDPYINFTDNELEILKEKEMRSLNVVIQEARASDNYKQVFDDSIKKADAVIQEIKGKKISNTDKYKKSITKEEKEKLEKEREKLEKKTDAIKKYKKVTSELKTGMAMTKKGRGTHFPSNPFASGFKRDGIPFGNLKIDVPQLLGHLKLIAYKDGKKVYDKNVDFDTVDLLTKRFNSRKKYSSLSQKVFDRLRRLNEMSSSKLGSSVIYYKSPRDLLDRLELLGGTIAAGNNSSKVKNEYSEIAHALHNLNEITNDDLNDLLRGILPL